MNLFKKTEIDFLAIGDIVTDAFIRLKEAEIRDSADGQEKQLCMTYGDKVPFEFAKVIAGVGNSANAAVSAARLGLSTALIADVGGDHNGKEMLETIQKNSIDTTYITTHKDMESNYHYVLWYEVDRTILVKHQQYPYAFPSLKTPPKWIYLSSLGENSLDYHTQIAAYLADNPEVKLVFQPGTYQMKFGTAALKGIYSRTHIFFCNREEAERILETHERDIAFLLKGIYALGPKIVCISDGIDGAYAFDGTDSWFMPIYPQEPYERTGAGDAFASTITVALALGKTLPEALSWGPVNSMSVVQYVGAQEGLLTQEKLLEYLSKAPADYVPKKI
jgi:ribokinase